MAKLQLIKDNVVINTIEVDCDIAVLDPVAGPGDIFNPETGVFSKPAQA